MADKELGALPAISALLAAALFHGVQDGNSRKVTAQQIADFVKINFGEIFNSQLPNRLKAFPAYVENWNNVRENGFYFGGPESVNTPAQPWSFIGVVKAQSSAYCVQRLTALGVSDPANNVVFERQIVNNVPSAWFRVLTTQAELDNRYNRLSQPVANAQLPDRLKDFGRAVIDWNAATESGVYFGDTATNRPDGIDGGLVGHVEAVASNAIVQTVTRWWQGGSTNSATWRRYKTGPGVNDWTPWFKLRFTEGELDERYNVRSQTITNSQLPGTQTGKNFTSFTTVFGGDYATGGDYFRISPSDFGAGKPALYFSHPANVLQWNIGLWDGSTTAGTINISAGNFRHNGQDIRTAATAYAKSETYTQAETRSLVTTARQVRLAGLGEIAATAFQWNEVASGCVLTGVFLDGNWGVRNYRYRAIQQTDLSGNWVTVAQS